MKEIYIIGNGGLSKEVFVILKDIGWEVLGFVGNECGRIKIGNFEFEVIDDDKFGIIKNEKTVNGVISVGNPQLRRILRNIHKDILYPNIIHPLSSINLEYNKMGEGNIFTQYSVFTSNITIGDFNYFNLGCTVGHDVIIGNYNVFNPTSNISGKVTIGNNNLFGVNSSILEKLNVGDDNIMGASSLITKDINNDGIYVGIPAINKKR